LCSVPPLKMPEHKTPRTAQPQQTLASGAALDEYMYHLRNGVRAHAPCMPFKQIDTKFRPLALLEDQGLRRKAPAMAQTMTRPARDNSQKAGNSREVKRTISTVGNQVERRERVIAIWLGPTSTRGRRYFEIERRRLKVSEAEA
jgi:hypothetical protein